ncbi:uncharacterized protein K460DRAFT_407111 [Cucurbitaria berberidis CBS 394.84]|uniref:Uncharacterized protein n=1 Tax=Cucurbitaria berberidis CBS 394.84 TaxID=1168544 RepID=A0A9P4GBS5_9PLEO|nr:uncharacterized protein K460DRAFT_407111 [Cucurbitaria berberidis CBS 394.84]KAF1842717.1 hypothetical protein K460DRAFT_407111 [Cucurbitaria berberidis CBS 394.84]
MQNEHGQGISHASSDSKIQKQVPAGLEENLPNAIHDTGSSKEGPQTNTSHAKGGGKASIVPQKIQEKLPESIERAVPNAIHDTGDTGGLHRKQ